MAVRTLGIHGVAGQARTGRPVTVGFLASISEEKGGEVALARFQKLLAERLDARLLMVGSERRPTNVALPEGSVTWMGRVSRERVLDEVMPDIDVLVLPTRCDSGPPYVTIEALQEGIR